MKTHFLLSILFLTQLAYSQSIASFVHHTNQYHNNANIAEVIETTNFYNSGNIHKETEYKDFNSTENLISLKRFNAENKLIWSIIYQYDSLQRVIRIDNKKWINIIGYQSGYSIYKYDSLGNCLQIEYTSQGHILNIFKYYFDKNSCLIRLEFCDANGYLLGYETAKYEPENNTMHIRRYNVNNILISSDDSPINYGGSYKQKTSNKYNEYDDLIYWERNWFEKDRVCYTSDYIYDNNRNWVLERRYKYFKSKNGKLKRKALDMEKTRVIHYNE